MRKLLVLTLCMVFTPYLLAEETVKTFLMQSAEGDRLGTVINGQPYYRSTGNNSHLPGTVFPFLGMQDKPRSLIKLGNDDSLSTQLQIDMNFIAEISDEGIAKKFEQDLLKINLKYPACKNSPQLSCGLSEDKASRNIIIRLGSLEAAIVSYSFGFGFWGVNGHIDTPEVYDAMLNLINSLEEGKIKRVFAKDFDKVINLDELNTDDIIKLNAYLQLDSSN